MKYSDQKPPNWEKLVALFGVDWKYTVVTWGDTVHAARPLTPDLEVHEAVHVRQQAEIGVMAWWKRFYEDPAFRLEQELEAYRAQFEFIRKCSNDRNQIFKIRDRIASDLAGHIYGNCISYEDAFKKIAERPQAVAA